MKYVFEANSGKKRTRVNAVAILLKNGLVVCIYGGASHVGAVAVAIPRAGLDQSKKHISVTSSVLTLVGHKDDVVARNAAETIAKHLDKVTTVTAGIHVEHATRAEIRTLIANSNRCVASLLNRISNVSRRKSR